MGDDNAIVALLAAVAGFLCLFLWIAWKTSFLVALGAAPILWILGLGFFVLMLIAFLLLGQSKSKSQEEKESAPGA